MTDSPRPPKVLIDVPLDDDVLGFMGGRIERVDWNQTGADIVGMYTYSHPVVDGDMLDRLPNLKVISNYGVGVDHIDLEAAQSRGIIVGNTPDILNGATADMGFALLLSSARRVVEGDRYARSPEFLTFDPGYMLGTEVHGQTIGIIGMGRIGLEIAQRARGFSMKILYHNRTPRNDLPADLQAQWVELHELLAQSDFVMLSCPLTDTTHHLIGSEQLQLMHRDAILINIARGPVVDTQALTEALQRRSIAHAGLDVTDPEPLPRDHPLLTLENVTITPHLGSATRQTRREMARISVENLLRGLDNRPLLASIQPPGA